MTATITELAPLSGPGLRASVAAQLRALADFIEDTEVEVSPFAKAAVHFFASSTEAVDREAAKFGATPKWEDNHYVAEKSLGNEVTYSALHICRGACRHPHETGGEAAA